MTSNRHEDQKSLLYYGGSLCSLINIAALRLIPGPPRIECFRMLLSTYQHALLLMHIDQLVKCRHDSLPTLFFY